MLDAAIEKVANSNDRPVGHSDRGAHYRSFVGALFLQGLLFFVINGVFGIHPSVTREGAQALLILILLLALTRKKEPSLPAPERTKRQGVVSQETNARSSHPVKQTFKMVPTDEIDHSGKG